MARHNTVKLDQKGQSLLKKSIGDIHTYESLAASCEVSDATIRRFFHGESIKRETAEKVCSLLKISLDSLILPIDTETTLIERRERLSQLRFTSPWVTAEQEQLRQSIKREIELRRPLPAPRYSKFIGRESVISKLRQALQAPHQTVTIGGIGGIGKTALAQQVMQLMVGEGFFYIPIWISARQEEFNYRVYRSHFNEAAQSNLVFILHAIADQLCFTGVHRIDNLSKKMEKVGEILSQEPYLVVIDNLETIEGYRSLLLQLPEFITGGSKALLTSRELVSSCSRNYTLYLIGMAEVEAKAFLTHLSYKTTHPDKLASDQVLKQIHGVTGGMPLAMELVVGEIAESVKSPNDILTELERISSEKVAQLYQFIYDKAWEELPTEARLALIAIGNANFDQGIPWERLQKILDFKDISTCIDPLLKRFLIDYTCDEEGKAERFFLHPLTRNYARQKDKRRLHVR